MSDEAEIWNQYKEDRKIKRWDNAEKSIRTLTQRGIEFQVLNESLAHYKVGRFDFWPTTGVFYNQKTKEKGRGVLNLIKRL